MVRSRVTAISIAAFLAVIYTTANADSCTKEIDLGVNTRFIFGTYDDIGAGTVRVFPWVFTNIGDLKFAVYSGKVKCDGTAGGHRTEVRNRFFYKEDKENRNNGIAQFNNDQIKCENFFTKIWNRYQNTVFCSDQKQAIREAAANSNDPWCYELQNPYPGENCIEYKSSAPKYESYNSTEMSTGAFSKASANYSGGDSGSKLGKVLGRAKAREIEQQKRHDRRQPVASTQNKTHKPRSSSNGSKVASRTSRKSNTTSCSGNIDMSGIERNYNRIMAGQDVSHEENVRGLQTAHASLMKAADCDVPGGYARIRNEMARNGASQDVMDVLEGKISAEEYLD